MWLLICLIFTTLNDQLIICHEELWTAVGLTLFVSAFLESYIDNWAKRDWRRQNTFQLLTQTHTHITPNTHFSCTPLVGSSPQDVTSLQFLTILWCLSDFLLYQSHCFFYKIPIALFSNNNLWRNTFSTLQYSVLLILFHSTCRHTTHISQRNHSLHCTSHTMHKCTSTFHLRSFF